MRINATNSVQRRCVLIARTAGGLATAVGVLVVLGWWLNIDALRLAMPGAILMRANAAACFILAGLSLTFLCAENSVDEGRPSLLRSRRLAQLSAGFVGVIAAATLVEYLFNLDLRIDELLVPRALAVTDTTQSPRMAEVTAVALLLLSISFLLADSKRRWLRALADASALMVATLGFTAVVGYLYGVHALYNFYLYSSIAFPTSMMLIALAIGVLFVRPDRGAISIVTNQQSGGLMARYLLPLAIFLPIFSGWLQLSGERARLYEPALGLALFTVSATVTFVLITWLTARTVNRVDRERTRSSEQLRVSEERLRLLIDNVTDYAIFMLDPKGRIMTWNAGAQRFKGYGADEIIGQPFSRFYTAEDIAAGKPESELKQAEKSGVCHDENWRLRKDGSRFWASVTITAIHDQHQQLIGFAKVTRDLTERREAEQAVRESEERFRGMANSAPVLMWLSDTDKLCTFFNKPWLDFTGRTLEQEQGNGWAEGVHPKDLERCLDIYAKAFEAREPFKMEYRLRRHDGEYRWVFDEGVPRFDSANAFVGYIGSCIDVTERKRAEEELRGSQLRLAGLVDSAMDAIITVDDEQRIVLFNRAAEVMFGYSSSAVLGQPLDQLLPADARQHHSRHMRGFGETGTSSRRMGALGSISGLRQNGEEFPLEASISHAEVEGGKFFTVILRDITERRQAELALQTAKENLEQKVVLRTAELAAAKERAELADTNKSAFLATMSHEIRTPLNAVVGFTGMLLMKLPGPLNEAQEDQLKTVQSSAQHLLSLMNDLLDLAKVEAGRLVVNNQSVLCQIVIDEVAATLRPLAENKGLQFLTKAPVLECQLDTDRRILSQILINLANNAIKFTDKGQVQIELSSRRNNGNIMACIEVSDTGIGIRPEDQEKLFQAFQRIDVDHRFEGTGLGLHLSQKLAAEIHGRIEMESEFGKGSRFRLLLPGD